MDTTMMDALIAEWCSKLAELDVASQIAAMNSARKRADQIAKDNAIAAQASLFDA